MHPEIHENAITVLSAVLASFVFGWLWHGPLFGRFYARLMNYPADTKPSKSIMIRSMVIGLIGTFLTAHVMLYTTNIWRPSIWGVGADEEWCIYGFFSGFYTWLGFYVPIFLNSVAWEGRSWSLFGFNVAYHFCNLQIIAMIVACCYDKSF